jgi:hypothetical protein
MMYQMISADAFCTAPGPTLSVLLYVHQNSGKKEHLEFGIGFSFLIANLSSLLQIEFANCELEMVIAN